VPAQGSADLWIAFGVQDVALPGADGDTYSFVQGAIRGYEKGTTGAITGTLTGTAGAPLQGVAVTAQMQIQDGAAGVATAYRTELGPKQGRTSQRSLTALADLLVDTDFREGSLKLKGGFKGRWPNDELEV